MKNKSKILVILLAIVTIFVVVTTEIIEKNNKDANENNIEIVRNYSNFYTVNSCLYRTITYLSSKDKSSLLLLLDEKYKEENDINEKNVLNLFDEIEENSTFDSKKMYYERINANIEKYYVYGVVFQNQIYDDAILSDTEQRELYFIVYMDKSNKTFSIEPYDGEIFLEGDTNGE